MGTNTAIKIAQKAINFLGVGSVIEDGIIGPITIASLNWWCLRDPEALFRALNGFQFIRYVEIVQARGHIFARGWMKRIQDYKG
jgi:lysozyme family protein